MKNETYAAKINSVSGWNCFFCAGLTFANDPKGEPPTDEPCCPEGSELVAEFEEVIDDPKGSPTRIKHGEMGKPGIRLGTPYSPGQRIDGMEVRCVEVSHQDDCEDPVLTMFAVGGGDSDLCVQDDTIIQSVSDGTQFSWDGPGCFDEDLGVWKFYPPSMPVNDCDEHTISLSVTDGLNPDCSASDGTITTTTKIKIWKPSDDMIPMQYQTEIPCPYVKTPLNLLGSSVYLNGGLKTSQEISAAVCRMSYFHNYGPETYSGSVHSGGGDIIGGSSVPHTGLSQSVGTTFGYTNFAGASGYCGLTDCWSGTPIGLTCVKTETNSGLEITLERVSSSEIKITFELSASDPCVPGACGIDGYVEINIRNTCDPTGCVIKEYRYTATHDLFPRHNFMINGSSLRGMPYDPCLASTGLWSLCGSGRTISSGWVPL